MTQSAAIDMSTQSACKKTLLINTGKFVEVGMRQFFLQCISCQPLLLSHLVVLAAFVVWRNTDSPCDCSSGASAGVAKQIASVSVWFPTLSFNALRRLGAPSKPEDDS
jgi:hypothetical protein